MTNKINGIDVSECDYFEKQHIEDMYESDDCNVCIDNFCALCWKECEKHNGCYFKQLKRLQKENNILKQTIKNKNFVAIVEENEELKKKKDEYYIINLDYETKISYLIQALEKLITETPEYNSCYYKDECGDNCTPKKQSKVEYCCYENVDKILTIINEALNDRD